MSNRKRQILFLFVCLVIAGRALADRMQSPLYIGSGQQAQLSAAGGGGKLNLSNDGGTHLIDFPTTTDTLATLAATQTLTNKTLTSPTLTTPSMTSPSVTSGGISNVGGGTAASQFFKTAIFSGTINASSTATLSPSGASQVIGAFGYAEINSLSEWQVIGTTANNTTTANCQGNGVCFTTSGSATSVILHNDNGSTAQTYYVVVLYQ